MNERTKLILETSIEDFINTGRLITSNYLFKKYDFGIRSAMIRRELNNLDSAGYLVQVHPSGGRVPTNKGYRFFVKSLREGSLEQEISREEGRRFMEGMLSRKVEILAELLAGYMNTLGAVYETKKEEFCASGLEHLFSSVEIDDKSELRQIIRDFEMLPKRLSETAAEIDGWDKPQVYVGRNPITRSGYLSVMSEKFSCGDGEFVFLTVSPRRIDYRKLFSLYRSLENETKI